MNYILFLDRMQILHLTPYKIYPAHSGGERGVFYPLQSFNKLIEIKSLTVPENRDTPGINFDVVLPSSTMRYVNPAIIFTLKKKLKETNSNILYAEHPFIALYAALFKRYLGCKLIVKSHNIEYSRFKSMAKPYWRIVRFVERLVHRAADYSFFVSREDLAFAQNDFSIAESKLAFMPYGVTLNEMPTELELKKASDEVRATHAIPEDEKILLFNGTMSYEPNYRAVEEILDNILPFLEKNLETKFKIVLCGKGLPQQIEEKVSLENNVIQAGFVDDIDLYFKGCDIFLNPVVEGGGVKTKLIEAIGFGKSVVSYKSGSYGIDQQVAGQRLKVVEDYKAEEFGIACQEALSVTELDDNSLFYEHHNWDKICQSALKKLEQNLF